MVGVRYTEFWRTKLHDLVRSLSKRLLHDRSARFPPYFGIALLECHFLIASNRCIYAHAPVLKIGRPQSTTLRTRRKGKGIGPA